MYYKPKDIKIGVLGGGQLAKMIHQESFSLDLSIHFMDKEIDCPVAKVSPHFHVGNIQSYEDVYQFGINYDIITIEIESVNIQALKDLESIGKKVYPSPAILETIQDKGLQKDFFTKNNFPNSKFQYISSKEELLQNLENGIIKFPFVQKLRKGGYDGKGVSIIRSSNDYSMIMEGECIIEELANVDKELSVIVVRSINTESKAYPSVSMIFHPTANLVEYLLCPAEISKDIELKAQQLAIDLANRMNIVGLLAVEMFLNKDGSIWINEVAPRPHNSGHHTLNNGAVSQFENHLRSIYGLPLGHTHGTNVSIMLNLLGEENYQGPTVYKGLEKVLSLEGVYVYLYGKEKTKAFRKMGHVIINAQNSDECQRLAEIVKSELKVISE